MASEDDDTMKRAVASEIDTMRAILILVAPLSDRRRRRMLTWVVDLLDEQEQAKIQQRFEGGLVGRAPAAPVMAGDES